MSGDLVPRWTHPDDQDYVIAESTARMIGTPSRPLGSQRCIQVKKDGRRCKRWSLAGRERCPRHGGYIQFDNVREAQRNLVEYARNEIVRLTPRATAELEKLLADPDLEKNVKLRTITEVLDRGGIRGGTEVSVTTGDADLSAQTLRERLEKLAERAEAAAGIDTGLPVIDAEVVDDAEQMTLFDDETAAPPEAPEGV